MSRLHNRKRLLFFGSLCIYGVLQHHLIRQLHSDVVDNNNDNNNNNNSHLPVVATPTLAVSRPRNESDAEGNKHGNDRSSLEKTTVNITHRYGHRETTHADPMQQLTRQEANQLKRAASIDYFSCCGAGHRLSKLADAYYAAKQLYFTVRVFFDFCSNQEVFSYLFGPKPLNEVRVLDKISAGIRTGKDMKIIHDMYIKVGNEVPGFGKLKRYGRNSSGDEAANTNTTSCPCLLDNGRRRFDSDVELFTDLRDKRFLGRETVESYRRKLFSNHTVIGLHIRAGNGEEGDFVNKNRTIRDTDRWCQSMSDILVSLSKSFRRENNNSNNQPPLLFIASDTATIISRLRTMLRGTMEVVDLQQDRIDYGKGVMFGQMGDVNKNGDQCKQGWLDTFTDMMLLSHVDVLVAGRPSSFTQSLPMTLVLSKPKSDRKVLNSFCEVNPEATDVVCYQDLEDWCCNGNTSFSLHTIQNYDYRRMPQEGGLNLEDYRNQLKFRPNIVVECMPTTNSDTRECLPYEMPDEKSQLMMLRKRQSHIKPRRRIND